MPVPHAELAIGEALDLPAPAPCHRSIGGVRLAGDDELDRTLRVEQQAA